MACLGCSCSTGKDSTPKGCGSGGCSTGGCNKKNTYDYLTAMGIRDAEPFEMVEVSFKNGARKDFYRNPPYARATTGDWVMVETGNGFDIGRVSLSGELVRLQMKKRRVREDYKFNAVIRRANERDMERYHEVRAYDQPAMVKARVLSRSIYHDMKISDVEFQADGRKATFYYTANGRIDFRELIRVYARDFRVKIEMRQIGARQETARLGGIGPCGRELCCSTWLTDFKSVSTAAARYQNIAINQTKLSGQCGRLKCCLNYELDTYIEALDEFPDRADRLQLASGRALLIKTDVFKRLMYYAMEGERGKLYVLSLDTVKDIIEKAKRGEKAASLTDLEVRIDNQIDAEALDYEAVNDVIDLPMEERRKKKKKKKKPTDRPAGGSENRPSSPQNARPDRPNQGERREKSAQKSGDRPQNSKPTDGQKPPQNQPRREQPKNENRPERKPENRPPNQRPPSENQPKTERRPENRPPQNPQRPPAADGAQPNSGENRNKNRRRDNRNRGGNKPPNSGGGENKKDE